MKTTLCRPVLVESKDSTTIIGWKNKITIVNNSISQLIDKYYQLILISLDPDERIEEGDEVYHILSKEVVTYPKGGFPKGHCAKVIATQDKLSPELIQQLIEEYNKDEFHEVKYVEIEMKEELTPELMKGRNWNDKKANNPNGERSFYMKSTYKLKLTNGFITIVDKEQQLKDIVDSLKQDVDKLLEDHIAKRKLNHTITYTEEDLRNAFKAGRDFGSNKTDKNWNDWFEQNKRNN